MNRQRADTAASLLIAAIFLFGGALSWQAYQRQRAFEQMGSMMEMGSSMGATHGTSPLWYVFGTLFLSAVVGGGYLLVRDEFTNPDAGTRSQATAASADSSESAASSEEQPDSETPQDTQSEARVLDLLPEDERRILEPVLSSPGLTQIDLRDRSDFSKSKVSQTVSALEKRGLLYRERQGRTYRVYPSDELAESQAG
ncbi:helix-turn-helix transcriptional regulator [Haloarcula laminariae]|uniref:helix-turn-helix transcriptional regulator n=1 Tax=Haloarcula laminariae TaxID=2961577 RepID=UPI0021C82E4A|nr:MarR family transcriptional regulator [Halomicroarcula laminariae]